MLRAVLLVAFGSALGGVARYGVSQFMAERAGTGFPWGTLLVNVLGSAAIGVMAGVGDSGRIPVSPETRQFLMIGVLGGFTTFSSFSLETLRLLQDGTWGRAGANVLVSLLLCLLAVFLGYRLARMV